MDYTKCKYCNQLYEFNSINNHMDNCNPNYDINVGLLSCFSCNKPYNKLYFSSSQLNKLYLARCKCCVENNNNKKYEKYMYNYTHFHQYNNEINNEIIDVISLNKKLIHYINNLDDNKVNELLLMGANPNYILQMTKYNINDGKWVLIYNNDNTEKETNDNNIMQPINPLRLCIFYLSNLLNSQDDYKKIYNIVCLLIKFGANKNDALNYYRDLYNNKCNEKNIFWKDIYNLLI